MGEFVGFGISVLFLEVFGKKGNVEFLGEAFAFFVDLFCIFIRADGEGGGHDIKVLLRCHPKSFPEPVIKADGTSPASFGFFFQTFDGFIPSLRIVFSIDDLPVLQFRDAFKFFFAEAVFRFRLNVGIMEETRYIVRL